MSSADESGRGDDHEARLSELDAQGHDRGAGNRHRRTGGGKRGCSQITAAHGPDGKALAGAALGLGAVECLAGAAWSLYVREMFSYEGGRQLSRQIIEGVAAYIELPEGGVGLDVGCGSGALTIACAKRNPSGRMVGIDRWGVEYASYSRKLCERNAQAEGVDNAVFQKGDARHLDFPDETFDAVTSNYVYHNITGADKQALLRETLRVLKKGGAIAIHDLMDPSRYGDMDAFLRSLREEGFKEVRLLPTADGTFMTRGEGKRLFLSGSTLLVGRK